MSDSIRLHPRYGVNPMIPRCFFCGAQKNEIVLLGAACLGEAPMTGHLAGDLEPCDDCGEVMKHGVILISCRTDTPDDQKDNPVRTGGWVAVSDDAVRRWFGESAEHLLKSRVGFLADDAWDKIGLPRGEALDGVPTSIEEFRQQRS